MKKKLSSLWEWITDNKGKTVVLVSGVLVVALIINNSIQSNQPEVDIEKTEEELLMERCDIFEIPDGYILTSACNILPAGDSDVTQEEVGYIYLRALSNLDLETAARYSYSTDVIKTYNRYFEIEDDFTYDQNFNRTVYKQALLSLAVNGVADTATFPDGRIVITFKIDMLDLTNKDFWLDDQEEIFENLEKYRVTESDSTKAKEYLYDYVLEYYQRPDAIKRSTTVAITIDRVSGYDHWLVSDDSALDAMLAYLDGESVVSHIMLQYDKQR